MARDEVEFHEQFVSTPDNIPLESSEFRSEMDDLQAAYDMREFLNNVESLSPQQMEQARALTQLDEQNLALIRAREQQAAEQGISLAELAARQEAMKPAYDRYQRLTPIQKGIAPRFNRDLAEVKQLLRQYPNLMEGYDATTTPQMQASFEDRQVLDQILQESPEALQEQVAQQEQQDQLSLADIRAMLGFKGGTPRGIGVRDFSKQRQQILDDYKEQYAAGQKYEAERRKAAEAEVAKARQRFEEASDLQGKFKFDPTRVLDSTGDVIAAAIFVGLSGAANAMAGQPGAKNQALEIINGTIDRDIQAQKMEYQQLKDRTNTAENLYARNMQLLQNERLAENLTKQQMLEFADGQAKISLKNVAANEAAAQFRANLNASLEKARLDTAEAMFKYQSDAGKKGSLTYTQQQGLRASIKQNFDASETFQVAEDALKVIAGGLADFSNDVNAVDRLIGNLTQIYQSKLAGEGDEPAGMIAESLGALSGIVSDKFAASQQLNSIIKQMAFSLASRSQSASSISNKDVQMFADLLRDKQADPRRVGLFFQHLRTKAELSAIADRLILDGAEVRDADQMALQQYLSIPGKNNMVIGTSEFGTPVTPYMAEYVSAYQTPVSSGLASYEVE